MKTAFRKPIIKILAVVSPLALTALSGCGIGVQQLAETDSSSSKALPGFVVNGHAHGGAFPIEGANITLMETQNNGYGGQGKLLEQVKSDATGYFTFDNKWTCDAGQYAYIVVAGGHTISSATTSNNNVIQVGVIGSCSQDLTTTAEVNDVNVFISEPSTIAAAYALNNFLTVADHSVTTQTGTSKTGKPIYTTTDYGLMGEISAPANNNSATPGCTGSGAAMTCTAAGLAHAFTNAVNLVDSVRYDGSFPSGLTRTSIPGNSQSIVPQAEINTLGNILQACVDSNGVTTSSSISATTSDGTACGNLFEYTTTPSGVSPTTTLQAALNIAQYPNNKVDQLFKLQPKLAFFTPALTTDTISGSSSLMSYSISIFYEGTGLKADTGIGTPVHLALDGYDNLYMLYTGGSGASAYSAIDGLSAGGQGLFVGAHVTGIANPNEIALDNVGSLNSSNVWVPAGGAWVADDSATGKVYRFPLTYATGNVPNAIGAPTSYAVANGNPAALAVDLSNNLWVARDSSDSNQSIFDFQYSSGSYSSLTLPGTPKLAAKTKRIFIDAKQNIFGVTAGTSNSTMYVYPYGSDGASSTLSVSGSMGASGGFGIAMNNADEAFIPLSNELQTANATQSGTAVTFTFGASSYGMYTSTAGTSSSFGNPGDVALDGSGHVYWTDYETTGKLFQMIPGSTANSEVSNGTGTLSAILPCFPLNNQCYGTNASLRGMAIDSSGAIWYVADYSPAILIQTLGLAENSWPLMSYAQGGQIVK